MQHVHWPRNSIVDGTVKSKIIFKKLRAVSFNASFDEFVNITLSSVYRDGHLRQSKALSLSLIFQTILAARL